MGRRITSIEQIAKADAQKANAPLKPGMMANKDMYGSGKGSKSTSAVKALGKVNRG